jgi:hypothetical protein
MARLLPIAAVVSAAALAACDSNARLSPDFLKLPSPPPVAAEPEPDARQIVRDNLAAIFAGGSQPKNVAVSRLVKARFGHTTCVRASVSSIAGAPIGTQTYLLQIERGRIGTRERVDPTHACAAETYEPV